MLRESQTSVPHHRWVPLPPGLLLICVCVFSLSFWVSGGIAKYLSIVLLEAEVQSHKGTWNWSERFEFLNGQGWGDTDLPVRMWARALHDTVPLLICWFWLSLSYTRTLSFSLSLSLAVACSLSLSLSLLPVLAWAPAVGGAGFPGIVGQLFLLCLLPLAQSLA